MIPEEAVAFGPRDGFRLEGTLAVPPGAIRGVVVCHPHPLYGGDMDNPVVQAVAGACLDAGLATLRFNFRGVGASEGVHDGGAGEQDDVRAALDLVETRLGSTPAVAGYSFGAAMAAAVVTAGRPVAGVALVAPPGSTAMPLDATRPALVVAGDRDHVCPPDAVQAWRAAAPPGSVHVVPGADHFFSVGLAGLHAAVRAWARRVAAQR